MICLDRELQRMEDIKSTEKKSPIIWGFSTYFAEGMPYTIIRQICSLFLRDRGIALESIGLTSLFGLPWILKFLWAPFLDRFGTKRQWMILMQGILTILFLISSVVAPLPRAPQIIAVIFFISSFFASTNDTAIDGYYLESLNSDDQAAYVGYRVMAYRVAMIFGTGVIGTIGPVIGWGWAFGLAAIVYGVFTLFHHFYLDEPQKVVQPIRTLWSGIFKPTVLVRISLLTALIVSIQLYFDSETYEKSLELYPLIEKISFSTVITLLLLLVLLLLFVFRKQMKQLLEKNENSYYGKAFLTFIDRPKIVVIFAVIIFIRTGEFMLSSMVAPFYVDLGIKIHYGWISASVGLLLSIAGAVAGGAMIKKFTLKRVLWPFLLLQNLTNLVYMFLAFFFSHWITLNTGAEVVTAIGTQNIVLAATVHGFDQFSGGLGTAVLMLLLMRLCVGEFKAAHYAIGTAFMSISGVFAGIFGGMIAEAVGYGWFFGVSFLVSIPGMIAVAFLPHSVIEGE